MWYKRVDLPVLVDPGVRPSLLPFEVLSLERTIQLRVVGISDEESSKGTRKL